MIIANYTVIADFTVISLWFSTDFTGFTVTIVVKLGFLEDSSILLVKLFWVKDVLLIVVKRNCGLSKVEATFFFLV